LACFPHKDFLVPTPALAKLVRRRLKAAPGNRCPELTVPRAAWTKDWVIRATASAGGPDAVAQYLAHDVFGSHICL